MCYKSIRSSNHLRNGTKGLDPACIPHFDGLYLLVDGCMYEYITALQLLCGADFQSRNTIVQVAGYRVIQALYYYPGAGLSSAGSLPSLIT